MTKTLLCMFLLYQCTPVEPQGDEYSADAGPDLVLVEYPDGEQGYDEGEIWPMDDHGWEIYESDDDRMLVVMEVEE